VKIVIAIASVLALAVVAQPQCDSGSAKPGKKKVVVPRKALPVGPPARVTEMCVTLGATAPLPDGRLLVTDSKVRGYGTRSSGGAAELKFVYRGPSKEVSRLGSGKVFRQLGLKLDAQDGCNVVYVMWRIEPASGVEVLVKQNPGQSVHSQCGNRGYRKVKPALSRPLPAVAAGASHSLQAELVGSLLRARVDGAVVLEAEVGDLGFAGPAGFRTDNVEAELELLAAPADSAVPCTRGGD
jgi:hypothetical protein